MGGGHSKISRSDPRSDSVWDMVSAGASGWMSEADGNTQEAALRREAADTDCRHCQGSPGGEVGLQGPYYSGRVFITNHDSEFHCWTLLTLACFKKGNVLMKRLVPVLGFAPINLSPTFGACYRLPASVR